MYNRNLVFTEVVLQPGTICNLDCKYCYLSSRKENWRMSEEVAQAVANSILEQGKLSKPVTIVWHGGEPLAIGIKHFKRLISVFEPLYKEGLVDYNIQTNATLINNAWCDLFLENDFQVGVSIDGTRSHTSKRVDWSGKEAFDSINRGISVLNSRNVKFGVIAVVTNQNMRTVQDFYDAIVATGCETLCINIEEVEGINTSCDVDENLVLKFWKELYLIWLKNPNIRVREFKSCHSYLHRVVNGYKFPTEIERNPYPTVSYDGYVFLYSPELAGQKSEKYADFIAGNVLDDSLTAIVQKGQNLGYAKDFLHGLGLCKNSCSYYNFCKGSYASNKFFEHGSMDVTETSSCRSTRQLLLDAVISAITEREV